MTAATVAAWVDDHPVPAEEVELRLARLRDGDRATALPSADTREGRQLRRWVTQVAVVEHLCRATTSTPTGSCSGPHRVPYPHRTNPDDTDAFPRLGRADAAALGSIVAAAWSAEPAVARTAAAVTAGVRLDPAVLERAAALTATGDGATAWSTEELLTSARLEAFSRWLAGQVHDRVRLEPGYEHPGDATQPDNVHEH